MPTGLEEKTAIVQKKQTQLAKQIAHWHIYFFNTTQKKFSAQVVEAVKQHGLDYDMQSIRGSLFKVTDNYKVNPLVTDTIVNMFNKANDRNYSRTTIEKLVNDFDDMSTSGNPDTVDWNIARPVYNLLIALEGKSHNSILPGYSLKKLEKGIRNLHVKDYSRLKRRLEEKTAQYKSGLIQVLSNIGDSLQNEGPNTDKIVTISDIGKEIYSFNFLSKSDFASKLNNIKEGDFIYHPYIKIKGRSYESEVGIFKMFSSKSNQIVVDFPDSGRKVLAVNQEGNHPLWDKDIPVPDDIRIKYEFPNQKQVLKTQISVN